MAPRAARGPRVSAPRAQSAPRVCRASKAPRAAPGLRGLHLLLLDRPAPQAPQARRAMTRLCPAPQGPRALVAPLGRRAPAPRRPARLDRLALGPPAPLARIPQSLARPGRPGPPGQQGQPGQTQPLLAPPAQPGLPGLRVRLARQVRLALHQQLLVRQVPQALLQPLLVLLGPPAQLEPEHISARLIQRLLVRRAFRPHTSLAMFRSMLMVFYWPPPTTRQLLALQLCWR